MNLSERWLLPDAVEEVLPPEARRIENLRRRLLDQMHLWGYQQVIPPMVEFIESLLSGVGHDLDLLTGKMTDQLSGRTLGISADATQQVARMDAHSIKAEADIGRYSYCVPIFHARKSNLHSARNPIQLGAELYGQSGLYADLEILSLALNTLQTAEVGSIVLDLGHAGLFRALLKSSDFSDDQESQALELLRRRAIPEYEAWLAQQDCQPALKSIWSRLPHWSGSSSVLAEAAELLKAYPVALEAVEHLQKLTMVLSERFPEIRLQFDLCELRGFNYHTGMVFAVYKAGHAVELIKGGRYDETGAVYGRSREATGFSCDLRLLAQVAQYKVAEERRVYTPFSQDPALRQAIDALRSEGVVVIEGFSESADDALALSCNEILVKTDAGWQTSVLNR